MTVQTNYLSDPVTGDFAIERVQDCTPIVENATALRLSGLKQSDDMRLAARIPMVIIEQYLNDRGVSYHEFLADQAVHARRLLNDPALAAFRVWEGRI
jgi:hypothetical protein